MIDAAVLRAMAAAGATVEIIIAAVEADALKDVERREAKRAGNAERQRKFKARRRGNGSNALPAVTPPIEEIIPPVSSNDETTPQSKLKADAKPADVEPEVWTGFVAQRRASRAAVTTTAIDGIRREATKAGWTLNDALAEIAARGWRGFKAEWVADKPPDRGGGANDYISTMLAKQAINA